MPLTDEDKAWMSEQLGTLGKSVRCEVIERIDALRSELIERIEALRSELIECIEALRAELIERNEKTETTLLTEFHKCASPVELRQRSHAAAMRAFDAELQAVSDRVTKIEG
jgi:hypothetical protein